MNEKTKCRNPECDRPATEETMQLGDLCQACHDAYRLGLKIGEIATGGYISGSDPAAVRYPYWKETKTTFDIYQKKIENSFAGSGNEYLIVGNGIIQAHGRAWDNLVVVDDNWRPELTGRPVSGRGTGWKKLTGFDLENAQPWAKDILSVISKIADTYPRQEER